MSGPKRFTAVTATFALVMSLATAGVARGSAQATTEPRASQRPPATSPNVLLIVTDDQRYDTLHFMPKVRSLLAHDGVRFTQAFVPTALCCPSRTSILTGRYAHSTGVWSNAPPLGGFNAFDDSSTLATWLDATHETALFGKYLNDYELASAAGYVPPGWDQWHVFSNKHGSYYDWTEMHFVEPGPATFQRHGSEPDDYSTTVLMRQAAEFIKQPRAEPFFLEFMPFAPHGPPVPAPRDAGRFSPADMDRYPNFNESKVGDKPDWVTDLPLMTALQSMRQLSQRARAVEALLGVDRAVGRFVRILEESGQLEDTLIIFMSDNGTQFGEHRWKWKDTPYEEAIRIPLVVRYDRLTVPAVDSTHMVLNVDIAPTIAELAGVTPDVAPEGSSLVPLLGGASPPDWRQDFVLEHTEDASDNHFNPSYCGVRSATWKYVVSAGGEEELYDLVNDPYELANQASNPLHATERNSMLERAHELCSPPPPDPGFTLPPLLSP